MKQTKNYGLHKADQDEYYDINITNENLDKIDEKMGEQSEAINQKGDVIKYDPITKKMKLMRGDILLSEAKISDATKKNAGIVKPADGLTVAEDGTLKVNIDGATLTMDQVNNVIKLADTLKDAINGAFPAANVANNQITTVEGFALDARQANPNIDGTLAKQISDLNGSILKYTDYRCSKILLLPSIPYTEIDETHTGKVYLQNYLKYLVTNRTFKETYDFVGIGVITPNSGGVIILHCYDLENYGNTGLPRYSNGLYLSLGSSGELVRFGTQEGIFYISTK